MVNKYLIIAAGGGLGAVLRYGMTNYISASVGRGYPFGTMAVNLLGSLLIGIAYVLLIYKVSNQQSLLTLLFMTGLLGGFTTYSAFALDAMQLLNQGKFLTSAIYIMTTTFGSLVACGVGIYVTNLLVK